MNAHAFRIVCRLTFTLALLVASAPALASSLVITSQGTRVEVNDALLAKLSRISVIATSHGKSARHEGYDLLAVLEAAGISPTRSLRGKQLGTLITVSAADGYQAIFALAELDPSIGNRQVLLVDRSDGKPLADTHGPWRLVVPADQRPARWVRQVIGIYVSGSPSQ